MNLGKRISEDLEAQFLTALLSCGGIDTIDIAMEYQTQPERGHRYGMHMRFRTHKAALIVHLMEADYFDVHYEVRVHKVQGAPQLTEKAALWIGKFYQWLVDNQQSYNAL